MGDTYGRQTNQYNILCVNYQLLDVNDELTELNSIVVYQLMCEWKLNVRYLM